MLHQMRQARDAAAVAEGAQIRMANLEAFDRAIESALGSRIVGTAILVAIDGRTVYRGVKGYFDREAGTPMREDAIFRLASVTKPMASATALVSATAPRASR